MVTISSTSFNLGRTLIGKASLIRIIKLCPAANLKAYSAASESRVESLLICLTKHGPLSSQKATPNFIPGTQLTKHSATSSTVLIK